MADSINPADFQTFTRMQAIANLRALDDDNYGDGGNYEQMSNEELDAEICVAGIVHDEYMKGVYNTEQEALGALMRARANRA